MSSCREIQVVCSCRGKLRYLSSSIVFVYGKKISSWSKVLTLNYFNKYHFTMFTTIDRLFFKVKYPTPNNILSNSPTT